MSTCTNSVVCCPPAVFPDFVMPPNILTQLTGLLWELPCVRPGEPPLGDAGPFVCNADNMSDSTVLNGDPTLLYDITILVRGIMELMQYTGGSVVAGTDGLLYAGGTPDPASLYVGHNIYKLEISDPAAVYYMNRWDGITLDPNICHSLRYSAVVQMYGGATITLSADVVNFGEITNFNSVVAPLVPGDPPFRVSQLLPYNGQFCQMDALAVS